MADFYRTDVALRELTRHRRPRDPMWIVCATCGALVLPELEAHHTAHHDRANTPGATHPRITPV